MRGVGHCPQVEAAVRLTRLILDFDPVPLAAAV